MQFWVRGGREEGGGLSFRPGAGEEGYDGDVAMQEGGCGKGRAGGEGLPVEVGEVEGFFAAEQGGGGEEGFAFGVLKIGPFAEVGSADLFCAGWKAC